MPLRFTGPARCSIGNIAPRGAPLTLQHLAANAVMAGCLPEYMPVLEAAVAAMQEGMFNLFGMQTTTHPCACLAIVHGPAAERLGMSSGAGAFGPGSRANKYGVAAAYPVNDRLELLVELRHNTDVEFDERANGYLFGFDFAVSESLHVLASAGSTIHESGDDDEDLRTYFGLQWFP